MPSTVTTACAWLRVALTEVFAKRDYQAATVDHLIAAAKISMGSFYDFFGGKEDTEPEMLHEIRAKYKGKVVSAHDLDVY